MNAQNIVTESHYHAQDARVPAPDSRCELKVRHVDTEFKNATNDTIHTNASTNHVIITSTVQRATERPAATTITASATTATTTTARTTTAATTGTTTAHKHIRAKERIRASRINKE